jgi:ketosteroid isomerase-like protein
MPPRTGPSLVLILAAFLLAASPALAQPATAPPESPATAASAPADPRLAAIEDLRAACERAIAAGDLSPLKPLLDPEFTAVTITGEEVRSFAEAEAYLRRLKAPLGRGGRYAVAIHVEGPVLLDGDLAIAGGTTDDAAFSEGAAPYRFHTRWTAVCRRHDGGWRILRVQASMDPVQNPFAQRALARALRNSGIFAGLGGIVIGWLARMFWVSLRRKPGSARSRPGDDLTAP